jgi:hypothetical protein
MEHAANALRTRCGFVDLEVAIIVCPTTSEPLGAWSLTLWMAVATSPWASTAAVEAVAWACVTPDSSILSMATCLSSEVMLRFKNAIASNRRIIGSDTAGAAQSAALHSAMYSTAVLPPYSARVASIRLCQRAAASLWENAGSFPGTAPPQNTSKAAAC